MQPHPNPNSLIGKEVHVVSRGKVYLVKVGGASERGGISASYKNDHGSVTYIHFMWDEIDELY